jgi:hypothetical protein
MKNVAIDLLGDDGGGESMMQKQQTQALVGLTPSFSSPSAFGKSSNGPASLFPPPLENKAASPSFQLSNPPLQPAVKKPLTLSSGGGLSAQDLSFFEGL